MRSKLTMLCLLGLLAAPGWTFAQPATKVDSLRWAMMMWEKTGDAKIGELVDSLYLCLETELDDGSGVNVEIGDGEGLSTTPAYDGGESYTPGRGFTHVWKGRNVGGPGPFDVAIVDLVEGNDPVDDVGAGLNVGVHFPGLEHTGFRIVITLEGEVVTDTTIADPGPTTPPGPFPFPDPPDILWIDFGTDSQVPLPAWCEKTALTKAIEDSMIQLGAEARGGAPTPVLGFTYQLTIPLEMWVKGSDKPVLGDRIAVVPQNQFGVPDYITGAQVIPRNLMESKIISASVMKYGLEHFPNPESEAELGPLNDTLLVRNIGSSGLDGIRTSLEEGTDAVWTDLRPLTLRDGETLDWSLGGAINSATVDTLWRFSTRKVGKKTFFSFEADPAAGWTDFNLQIVRNGNVLRERTVPNGFEIGVTGLTLDGFGMATVAAQGWDGFLLAVLRNGAEAEIRVVPKGGTAFTDIRLNEVRFDASSPFGDMEVAYEEIKWTVVAAVAPHAREADARRTSPVVRVAEVPRLQGNYPEPFNPVTTIRYALPEAAHVRLEVFDLTGRRVALLADGERPAGQYAARFDASRLASGVYLYRLRAGATVQTRTMMLLK